MSRTNRRGAIAGAIVGLLVWAYDYDFFVNAGGPATPISNAILRTTHMENSEFPVNVAWLLLVIMVLGAAAGFASAKLIAVARGRR